MSEDMMHTSSADVGDVTKGQTAGFAQRRQKERKEEAKSEPATRALVIGPGLQWTSTTSVLTAKRPLFISDVFSVFIIIIIFFFFNIFH